MQTLAKLILLSVIIAMFAIPMITARMKSGRRGLRWTIILIVIFNLVYLFAVRFIYPRLI